MGRTVAVEGAWIQNVYESSLFSLRRAVRIPYLGAIWRYHGSLMWKRVLAGFLLAAVALTAVFLINLIWFRPFSIDHFFEWAFLEFALDDPQMLSSMGLLDAVGLKFVNDDLTDASPAREDQIFELMRKDLDLLRRYDREALDPAQQLSYDILEWFLENGLEGEVYRDHDYAITQRGGLYQDFVDFMTTVHKIEDAGDAEDYLARLSKAGHQFDQQLEHVDRSAALGIVPPSFVLEKALENLYGLRRQPLVLPEGGDRDDVHPLVTYFEERLAELEISEQRRRSLRQELREHMERVVNPAYDRTIARLEALLAGATADAGVWKHPDGDAYYRYRIRSETTTDYDPEALHRLGRSEVDRILGEMRALLAAEGYKGASVAEHMQALSSDPRFLYSDDDAGREQILADYRQIIGEIETGMDQVFDLKPKAGLEVRRVPEFRQKTAAGGSYQGPSMDGSRPGIFYANLYDVTATPKWAMRTLAYHEAIPGHHFQIAIRNELKGLPTFRNILGFTSYSEGWALYAERLAWELGYQDDPYDNLGRLQDELLRAVRLVVDTGLHNQRWSREQAIEYMADTTGMAASGVESEIERYIVWPGQALAYKVGQLKLLELRERMRHALGERFEIRQFHNVVLGDGALPLTLLEARVDAYIEAATARLPVG